MKIYIYRIFLFNLIFTSILLANENEKQTNKNNISSNSIYLELGGQGIGLSVNYDYRFHPNWTFRAGASFLAFGVGLPFSINYLTGYKKSHHLEFGAGLTYAKVSSFFGGESEKTIIPTFLIGYRFQPKSGGLIFKISLTPLLFIREVETFDIPRGTRKKDYELEFQPWAGISVGYCF